MTTESKKRYGMKKQTIRDLLTEPSTYGGIAVVLIAAFGLEALSAEQITVILAGVAGIFLKEKAHK